MDELQLLRDCLPEQRPPGPDVVASARERLNGGRRSRRVPLAGVRPARRGLLLWGGLPTAGIAVAAAVTVAVTVAGPASNIDHPPSAAATPSVTRASGAASKTQPGYATGAGYSPYSGALPTANAGGVTDGRAVLLTAARQVAKATQPAAERYWVTSAVAGNFELAGPVADPYLLLDESQVQNWAARSPKDGSPDFAKQLGAAPVSAADRAAWQRDGSPTEWKYVGQSDGIADAQGDTSGLMLSLSMAGDPMTSLDAGYGSQQFPVGAKTLTLAQLQALPADPATLKKLILAGGVAPGETPSAFLLDGVIAPILEMPVTPAVRAALYEMLASMPGIQSLGEVTDPAGRQGEAVAYTAKYADCGQATTRAANGYATGGPVFSSCTTQEILIIDPATGLPLAEELRYAGLPPGQQWTAPDQLFSYEIFGPSHWTNANRPSGGVESGTPLAGPSPNPADSGAACVVIGTGPGTTGSTASPTVSPAATASRGAIESGGGCPTPSAGKAG
ncbi:MAG TPA: hypothetical protein VHZ33_22205 [Trebonia sp.]|jgi:hypothetical protein|nr:hypothetical protein [Trebonia sp.]